eukprot:TRINITY_DN12577_c1_g1_i1.p1 TRINITY_DN12577_c1_g1~~TRINITY_DN12577_c1_g1_i1.p1  ORF type:complete len:148 (+),score=32.34 TRINITY_DN12577_c1_g1_i1:46-444(+)
MPVIYESDFESRVVVPLSPRKVACDVHYEGSTSLSLAAAVAKEDVAIVAAGVAASRANAYKIKTHAATTAASAAIQAATKSPSPPLSITPEIRKQRATAKAHEAVIKASNADKFYTHFYSDNAGPSTPYYLY